MASITDDAPDDTLLALCFMPAGVRARDQVMDAGVALMGEVHASLYNALPDGDEPSPEGSDNRVSVAIMLVAQVAMSLVGGIRTLLPGNAYAANALVRQMVEVEYLSWTCANDHAEAVDWLTSDRQARRNRWQPGHLRQRAGNRFNAEDYAVHCEVGGHPTPPGILILHGATSQYPQLATMPEVTGYEATLHFVAICDFIAHAVPDHILSRADAMSRAHAMRADWEARDPACLWPRFKAGDPEAQQAIALALAQGAADLAGS